VSGCLTTPYGGEGVRWCKARTIQRRRQIRQSFFVIPLRGTIIPLHGMIIPACGMIVPQAGITKRPTSFISHPPEGFKRRYIIRYKSRRIFLSEAYLSPNQAEQDEQ
jgi:hypothetical protein